MTDVLQEYIRTNWPIRPLAHFAVAIDGTIQEVHPMTEYNNHGRPLIPTGFADFLKDIQTHTHQALLLPAQRAQLVFESLDVQPGDRVRLTRKPSSQGGYVPPTATDASTLEGVVLKVKKKEGVSRVQIAGFDTAGNGVFWPVTDYKVEVLHRAYRWTDRDRVIAEIADRKDWATTRREDQREADRRVYGARADRIMRILADADAVESAKKTLTVDTAVE